MNETTTINVGFKVVALEMLPDGQAIARCPCHRLQSEINISLTQAQALELLQPRWSRRSIHEVLPNHPPEIREVFITGTTPAEWDADIRRRMHPAAHYLALGYSSVAPSILKNDPRVAVAQRAGARIKV